jgi:hypothetical protein
MNCGLVLLLEQIKKSLLLFVVFQFVSIILYLSINFDSTGRSP